MATNGNLYSMASFDADQTLFNFHRVMMEALEKVAEYFCNMGIDTSSGKLKEVRDRIASKYIGQAIDMLELRKQSFLELTRSLEITDAGMRIFQDIRFGKVYFYEGTLDTLTSLRESGVEIALITNGNSDPAKAGIENHFDHIILGEQFPYKKPDPRIFSELVSRSGIPAQEIIHIGDNLETDVLGANRSGMKSVWFNQYRKENTSKVVPDYEISHLTDLKKIIAPSKPLTNV